MPRTSRSSSSSGAHPPPSVPARPPTPSPPDLRPRSPLLPPRAPGTRTLTLLCLLALLPSFLVSCVASQAERLARSVEIRRTAYGVPHILAESLEGAAFGLAWVMMEDYREQVPRQILRANGRLSLALGRDELEADFPGRLAHDFAVETFPLLPRDVQQILTGFAAGVNHFIELRGGQLPEWVTPTFTPQDIHARDVQVWDMGAVRRFTARRGSDATGVDPASDPPDTTAAGPGFDPEEGSNAWAFAPSRTASGHAILLRNPHLSFTAGYYEAHLTVPGVLNFYGDFRLGGPFTVIGGFNDRLGWATTNNSPDLAEIYALLRDPLDPDAYLFGGESVPLETRSVTVEFTDREIPAPTEEHMVGAETRYFRFSSLGPVLFETQDTLYVLKSAALGLHRLGEQWLRMMQARDLEEWKEAMRMRAKYNSNFTYADADGNIFYVWNASIPLLPRRPSGDSVVFAAGAEDVWTELYPWDDLPQLLNPGGGYVQNANDPPYHTNLNEPLRREVYPANFPEPRLGFRTQNSLELVHNDSVVSLEDVVELKHSMKMILADRVKEELVATVRARNPSDEVARALDLVADWDNRVARESRGAVLFKLWASRYFELTEEDQRYRVPWSEDAPTRTPWGLGNRARAMEAFQWAVDETASRFGSWDVAWGEVHRIRAGDLDLAVGGCSGALGCFRVIGYREDQDGKYKAWTGDSWVLAVEFGETPRGYSVLLYGNSNQEDSPYFYDQAEMFANEAMKVVAFTEDDIQRDLVTRYRPGEERPR
jgi:acyl-homoserine-lactone acylase